MRIAQKCWTPEAGWSAEPESQDGLHPQLVLCFAAADQLRLRKRMEEVRSWYPEALLFGCSSAGEIHGDRVRDGSLSATAIEFESTRVRGHMVRSDVGADIRQTGELLVAPLLADDLRLVMILSEGLRVNGSQLVRGVSDHLSGVPIVGGLAGDAMALGETLVVYDDVVAADSIAAVGFYGDRLEVGCGSLGGWDPFGPERRVTRSEGNVLYQLDGHSALALYRRFLGPRASELPASALLFPLSLRIADGQRSVVRTVTGINQDDESLIFAGDIPEGSVVRLMKANFERLLDGAVGAAEASLQGLKQGLPEFALLISCVGRKMVLQQRIEEEIEGVREVVGPHAAMAGFYSLGEISPFVASGRCELHNQTMTVTGLREV